MNIDDARQRIESAKTQYGAHAGLAIDLVISEVRSDLGAKANELVEEFDLELEYNIAPMEPGYSTVSRKLRLASDLVRHFRTWLRSRCTSRAGLQCTGRLVPGLTAILRTMVPPHFSATVWQSRGTSVPSNKISAASKTDPSRSTSMRPGRRTGLPRNVGGTPVQRNRRHACGLDLGDPSRHALPCHQGGCRARYQPSPWRALLGTRCSRNTAMHQTIHTSS